jgi:hypothetical protein
VEREVESGRAALDCGCPRQLRQFHGLQHFQWWASSSRVSSFDLGGYSVLTAVFFGWSHASSSSISVGASSLLLRCSRQFCCSVSHLRMIS